MSNARLLRRDCRRAAIIRRSPPPGDGPLAPGVWCHGPCHRGRDGSASARRTSGCCCASSSRSRTTAIIGFASAQTLQDAGFTAEAAKTYAKRAAMGGWDEEAWYARLQEARCLLALNDETGFLRAALAAFNQRPQRAEPLYDLARFYRERGMSNASVLYAEAGLALDRPGRDALFVEDFVYTTGLREEYSIAAFYSPDPQRKERGHVAADWLTLSRAATPAARAAGAVQRRLLLRAGQDADAVVQRPPGRLHAAGGVAGDQSLDRCAAAISSSWCSAA